MMSDSQRKEIDAFFNFFAAFDLTIPVATLADLSDGQALFEVLAVVCVFLNNFFRATCFQ